MIKKIILAMVLITLFTNQTLSSISAAIPEDSNNAINESEIKVLNEDETLDSVTESVYSDPLEYLMSEINDFSDPSGNIPTQKYIIKLKKNNSSQNRSIMMENNLLEEVLDVVSLELTTDQVNHIVNNDLVESIEIDRTISIAESEKGVIYDKEIRESSQTIPWGIHSTGAYMSRSVEDQGSSIKVAVLDTGVSSHSDINISGGVSFVESNDSYQDDNGHGTHIAGTIASIDNNQGIIGFSDNIELFSIKVLDSSGNGYTSSVIQGIEWAINEGINIINMSFVSSEHSNSLDEAISLAEENGIIIVGAAGNGGLGEDTIQYPAKYPGVLAVGAVDKTHTRASFSATGPDLDFVAPGVDILSTTRSGLYGTYSGTSQAAAHVTGALALLWSHNSDSSKDELEQMLTDSATELGTSEQYGHGLINIAKAFGIISGSIAPIANSTYINSDRIWVSAGTSENSIASYDKYGSGMIYEQGDTAVVGLKLEGDLNGNNPHSEIDIEVYAIDDPSTIIYSEVINNPELDQNIEFQWLIPTTLSSGQYIIKFKYPAIQSGDYDDYFDIFVAQAGVGPDSYEPNNTVETAYTVRSNSSYISYISSVNDIDFYKFTAQSSGYIEFELSVPVDVDYDMQVFDQDGYSIAYNPLGSGQVELLGLNVVEDESYYIRITGYSGDYSVNPYRFTLSSIEEEFFPAPTGLIVTTIGNEIKLTWKSIEEAVNYELQLDGQPYDTTYTNSYIFTDLESLRKYRIGVAAVFDNGISSYSYVDAFTSIPELHINQPKDVISEEEQLFTFTPATTGIYQISTSDYMGQGNTSDTILTVYNNESLTQKLYENDDVDSSTFSELRMKLEGGHTYYVRLSWMGFNEQSARITASVIQSSIPYIYENQPTDINEGLSTSSSIYVFIPERSGKYQISTSYYNGVATGRENDTVIEIFSDPNLIQRIVGGINDDRADSLFSEANVELTKDKPYYVRVKESSGKGVYARLLVTSSGNKQYSSLVLGDPSQINNSANEPAFYQFIPSTTNTYRIFTSQLTNSSVLTDTVIEVYSDAELQELISMNDDVNGDAPYGTTFSKIDITLTAGETYYIVVRSYDSRDVLEATIMIEDTTGATKAEARPIEWGELITTDTEDRQLEITSNYDVDYYRIELSSDEQVYISVSSGAGIIEDENGRLYGYFSQGDDSVFNLKPGIYYLRVQERNSGRNVQKNPPYDYELTVEINDVEIVSDNEQVASIAPIAMSRNSSTSSVCPKYSLDATPGQPCNVLKWNYKNKKASTKLVVEVVAPLLYGEREVYKKEISGGKAKGEITSISWNGQANTTENIEYVALEFQTQYGKYYYAKNGDYSIRVTEYYSSGSPSVSQVAKTEVNNNPLEKLNWVPLPPQKAYFNGKLKKVTGENKADCNDCQDYFYQEIMSPNIDVPYAEYVSWSKIVYGKSGLERFWGHLDDALIYNEGLSVIDNAQNMLNTAGMIPVFGIGADAFNGVIYFIRGENAQAILSAASIIPVVEIIAAGTKGSLRLMRVEHVLKSCMELDCMKKMYVNLPDQATTKDLKKELAKVVKKPEITDGIKDWQAHHIIPKGGTGVFRDLQKILATYEININSAANGVWLPIKSKAAGVPVDKFLIINSETRVEWLVAAHKKHSPRYGDFLLERLRTAKTKEEVLHEINEVRKLLLSGEIDLVNPIK